MAKIITFFENSHDNTHCLQSCIKSLLSFYFFNDVFTDKEIDTKTIHTGGWSSWLPPAVIWLNELGLNVKLYSEFDYERFINEGEKYVRELKGEDIFNHEKRNGSYQNISLIQEACSKIVKKGLWEKRSMPKKELESELENENTFAIGKTVYEWLDGDKTGMTSHYILLIKKYGPEIWRAHDPGLPGIENRKIPQEIDTQSILGDLLIVRGLNNKIN